MAKALHTLWKRNSSGGWSIASIDTCDSRGRVICNRSQTRTRFWPHVTRMADQRRATNLLSISIDMCLVPFVLQPLFHLVPNSSCEGCRCSYSSSDSSSTDDDDVESSSTLKPSHRASQMMPSRSTSKQKSVNS